MFIRPRRHLIDANQGLGTNLETGHTDLTFEHQQTTIVEGAELGDAMEILAVDGSIGLVVIGVLQLQVVTKSQDAQGAVARQGSLGGGKEQVVDGIVGEGLEAEVMTGPLDIVGHDQSAPCALAVEGVFIDLVVGLAADKQGIGRGSIADALHIAVGQSAGAIAQVLERADALSVSVEQDADEAETVCRGLVVDQGKTVVAYSADAAIVARRQLLVEVLLTLGGNE